MVLLKAFQQLLDGGCERGDACCERTDILLDSHRRLVPQLWGKGGMVFMGLDHTRLSTGKQVSHTVTT